MKRVRASFLKTAIRRTAFLCLSVTAITAGLFMGQLVADTLSIPFDNVSDGQLITASIWNSNFQSIETVVNGNLNDINIKNGGITGSTKLADLSVPLGKLASNSVDSSKIVDLSVANDDIANATIAEVKLDITSSPSTNDVMYYDGSKMDWRPGYCQSSTEGGYRSPGGGQTTVFSFVSPVDWCRFGSTGVGNCQSANIWHWNPQTTMTVTYLSNHCDTAPGAGESIQVTVREGTTGTTATCTINNTDTACTWTGSEAIASDVQLDFEVTESGGSAANDCTLEMCWIRD